MSGAVSSEPLARLAAWNVYMLMNAPLQGRFPFRSRAWIERAQRRRIRRIVAHAYENVPYYQETMDRLGLPPSEIRTAADLARLPLLERADLQRDPDYFTARNWPKESCARLFSGGSSGAPLTVYREPFALFQDAGARERHRAVTMKLAGKRWRLRQLMIVATQAVSRATIGDFDSRSLIPRSFRVVGDHIPLREPLSKVIARLNEFRPDSIGAPASFHARLFLHLYDTGIPFHRPKVIHYSGEALSDPMRRLITDEFGISVTSTYGAMEAFNIGFECEEHAGLHLNVDLNPLRLVDREGRDVADGESGEVVVSNLVNRGTVVLNYRLGDLARMLPAPCRCGRTLPLMSFVEGRVNDWVRAPSGEPIHPQEVRLLIEREVGILRYQVIQRAPARFELLVVPRPSWDPPSLRNRVAERLGDLLGGPVELRMSVVDDLPKTPSGKVRPVVSRLSGSPAEAQAPPRRADGRPSLETPRQHPPATTRW
jgi:phenylacetate-CoA ligase